MKKLLLILLFIPLLMSAQDLEDEENEEKISSKNTELTKSPMGAVWRSLIFPGLGQFYVEKYWKVPLFAGGAGTLYFFAIDNHIKFSDFQDQLENMEESDPEYSTIKAQRDFYLDNRDQSIFFLAGVYLLASIDAYVGAHLYDFTVDDDISLMILPGSFNSVQIGFSIKF